MLKMSWSKVIIKLGETGANEAFAEILAEIGIISDKSTNLSTEDGESLVAKATGGATVAYEETEGDYIITFRIKEMDLKTEQKFINATYNEEAGELTVKSNVIDKDYSILVLPKNVGAIGLKARKGHLSFKPGHNEGEGQFIDVTYRILQCTDGELYKKFRTKAADYTAAPGA